MNLLSKTIGTALVVATFAFSFDANAGGCRRDNHNGGKVLGAILGGAAGALLNKDADTAGTVATGVGGAVLGGVLGDQIDDKNDCEDAYDIERGSLTRREIRDLEREEQARLRYEQEQRRQERRSGRVVRNQGYDRYDSYQQSALFQCQQDGYVRYGYNPGPNYVLVDLRSNQIVEAIGNNLQYCYDKAAYLNGYR